MCRKREEDCATLLEFQNYKLKRKEDEREKDYRTLRNQI
jgi:hypothetical protein